MSRGIDKVAVLERISFREFYGEQVALPNNSRTEVLVKCPWHEDTKPSMSLNLTSGLWNCHAGCGGGDIFAYVQKRDNVRFPEALKQLATQVGLFSDNPAPKKALAQQAPAEQHAHIDPALVDSYHTALMANPAKLAYLTDKRGLRSETLAEYKIGWHAGRGRYSLPVTDAEGNCVNLRLYTPTPAADQPKIESWKAGYGSVRLYPSEVIDTDTPVVCEGEWDCLLLRQNGIPAWTTTGGADSFPPQYARLFTGKRVTLCHDIDAAGKAGAKRTASLLASLAKQVRIAQLPITEPPNGDVTDWFVTHNRTAAELKQVFENADVFKEGAVRPGPKEFRNLVPPTSWLETYVDYGSEITDAPTEFHLAVGLATISAVIGNNVWFHAWGADVYLNLWSILLAPSGFFRKTTSQRMGLRLVSATAPENILPNDFTQEKMVENLAKRSAGIISVVEFGALLKQLSKDYNLSLKEFLTELYDANDYIRDTKQGRFEITRPAVSIIAASTIDWLLGNAKTDDFRSGFFARFLFWPATEKNGWKGMGEQGHSERLGILKYQLGQIAQVEGRAVFPSAILVRYNDWLRKFEEEVNEHKLPIELQGFYTRLATYVLKFAVLYEIACTYDLNVTMESMEYGIRLAEYLKSHLVGLIEDEITVTGESRELKTIRQLVEREPGIDRNTLLRRCKMTSDHLTKLTMTLIESDQIRVEVTKGGGRPKQTYYPSA